MAGRIAQPEPNFAQPVDIGRESEFDKVCVLRKSVLGPVYRLTEQAINSVLEGLVLSRAPFPPVLEFLSMRENTCRRFAPATY